ncbi:hypothetical protein QAD02_002968 [Eretmocerus hayati]|uniref:Uncharacterized protein n=1 Tax=Eretmocerus hayati TaxID=131215 RepID=A0ACC2NKD1_9HYME|nr:hypothetical protein QAD02_002968 [Eretmocerus hayati]
MEKLKFEFTVRASADGTSNVISITPITTEAGHVFLIPEERQPAGRHKAIVNTACFRKIKNSLKMRHETKNVGLVKGKDLTETHLDGAVDLIFGDQFLEGKDSRIQHPTSGMASSEDLKKILEALVEKQDRSKYQSFSKLAGNLVIEEFSGKNTNTRQWIDMFGKECERFEITGDSGKIDILRLHLGKTCLECQKIEGPRNSHEEKSVPNSGNENYTVNSNEHIDVRKFQCSMNHLDARKRLDVIEILDIYNTILAKDKYDMGQVKDYEAHIDSLVGNYRSKRPDRCSSEDRKEIEERIRQLLSHGLIEES